MRPPRLAAACAALLLVWTCQVPALQGVADPAVVDRAVAEFWQADSKGVQGRIDAILETGATFDDVLSRLRRGRDYAANVPHGLQRGRHRTFDGIDHSYTFVIPESYDPATPYQVRVQLHGGIGRTDPPDRNRQATNRLPGVVDEILVFPTGWDRSMWWSATQVDNLSRILDKLKRTYNVDENRVYMTGTSDGGTGAFFFAFRDTTPWASFAPLIGNMTVLATPEVRADGEMFPGNAVNKPFFIVNAGRDRLYPAHVVQIYVEHLEKLGTEVVFHVKPESDHSTAWWPEEVISFEEFVHEHPRQPLPDTLSWETERIDRYNRAHWLVIDRLGDVTGQSELPDSNLLQRGEELDFGLRINSSVDRGRRVWDATPDSNAYTIGLRKGDRFVEVDSRPVQSGSDIADAMQRWEVGDDLTFVVERDGKRLELTGTFDPAQVDVPPAPIFPRSKPSGRVDLVRKGNTVEASTRGVKAFTLLLSPSVFNFKEPVKVVANGRTAFEGMVEPKLETMLKWAARDNDRTMIFGAELPINLEK